MRRPLDDSPGTLGYELAHRYTSGEPQVTRCRAQDEHKIRDAGVRNT